MEKAIKKHAVIFILPTLAAFIIGFIVPFVEGLYLSFCKFTTVGNDLQITVLQLRTPLFRGHLDLPYCLQWYPF